MVEENPFFAESDLRCIQDGSAFFRVEGMVEDNDGVTKNILVFHDGSKKRIQLDHEGGDESIEYGILVSYVDA